MKTSNIMTAERQRLQANRDALQEPVYWKRWGPYLSERQWGTVREDYSNTGSAWESFSHAQSGARAYRWGEDGIGGICDDRQLLCFAIGLWNHHDPILKERLFGLTGTQGNHGEDVKEYYFYLDSTPTHSYLKFLYKYPQTEYPYAHLVEENQRRSASQPEFELLDTGIFDGDRYFDVLVEYAKATPDDILIQIQVINRGSEPAQLDLLPTLWFRNTWSWEHDAHKPMLKVFEANSHYTTIAATHPDLDNYWLYCQHDLDNAEPTILPLLFTENETNYRRVFGGENSSAYVKDGIQDYVIHGCQAAVNPHQIGTKVAPHYVRSLAAGETQIIRLRLANTPNLADPFGETFTDMLHLRQQEADDFYQQLSGCSSLTADRQQIQRQAFAGLLWSKQYYHYSVERWLQGDPTMPEPPLGHQQGRNRAWTQLDSQEILSMPDKWEYPWFAAWDLAFHCLPFATIDPEFAKQQLDVLTREWYMHPNGQLPAYEWAFGDVNPPVHAWATWQVYKIEQKMFGKGDRLFLERVFQKLLLNFTWWVNRKDPEGRNVFEGGFLGLDNIGIFDRSAELPTGGRLEQSDGTSWMAMYCLNMLTIALELAQENPVYEDMATKFFEHFIYIADAMNNIGVDKAQLWDEADGFYYDVLHLPNGERVKLKVRSMVGLIPLFAVTILEPDLLERLPGFQARMKWFINNRPDLKRNIASMKVTGVGSRRMLALGYATMGKFEPRDKLRRILTKLLDENEFLSDYGIRSVSKIHAHNPYTFTANGQTYHISYDPAESTSGIFGGNSNWRGPIWFPLNYLIIESLQQFHSYLGDAYQVECPTGSGRWLNLADVATNISQRLIRLFEQDAAGNRPVNGDRQIFQTDPHWQHLIQFYEYFHGDNGTGLGASHQTGWTAIIANLLQQQAESTKV